MQFFRLLLIYLHLLDWEICMCEQTSETSGKLIKTSPKLNSSEKLILKKSCLSHTGILDKKWRYPTYPMIINFTILVKETSQALKLVNNIKPKYINQIKTKQMKAQLQKTSIAWSNTAPFTDSQCVFSDNF